MSRIPGGIKIQGIIRPDYKMEVITMQYQNTSIRPPQYAPKKDTRWVHSKTQNLYKVLRVAKYTEPSSEGIDFLVIYERINAKAGINTTYARPLGMWNESVEVNGEIVPRFTEVSWSVD
jgi:hypothetical protein